eukprot:gene13232-9479_t
MSKRPRSRAADVEESSARDVCEAKVVVDDDASLLRQSKRARKQPELLTVQNAVVKKDLVKGHGKALKDLPKVAASLKTYPARGYHYYLETLHCILFGTTGSNTNRRTNILNFSGFPAEVDRTKKFNQIARNAKYTALKCGMIRHCLEMLCLETSGDRDTLIDRLLDFLYDPR